jgi:hypothetical protein
MAAVDRSHWPFWPRVGSYAAAGFLFLLSVMTYCSAFSADMVERRVPGNRLPYIDIQRVKWTGLGTCQWRLLVATHGRRMRMYGGSDHLIEARELLCGQIPQAFKD